jgi:uncharacterized protein
VTILYLIVIIEWDDIKNQSNFKKHGIWFEETVTIFDNTVITAQDNRKNYGEDRFISIGMIADVFIIIVVHTNRNGKLRIISARRANERERKKYYEFIQNQQKSQGRTE